MNFEWQAFYEELADKFLENRERSKEFLEKISHSCKAAGLTFREVYRGWIVDEIDPFSAFEFVNCRCRDDKKVILLLELKRAFGLKTDVPLDFSGIPQFDKRNPFMFQIDDRIHDHIDELWRMFKVAIEYADERCSKDEFVDRYTSLEGQKNVSHSLTIALFCIRPDVYVNLDTRMRDYLFTSGMIDQAFVLENKNIEKNYKDGRAYLDFCCALRQEIKRSAIYGSVPELSFAAYEWDIKQVKINRKGNAKCNASGCQLKSQLRGLSVLEKWLNRQDETERRGGAVQRIGQDQLRKYLLLKYGRCAVTKLAQAELLVASHIVGWKECKNGQHLDPDNVLLLAKNYDSAFDKHLISFGDDGHIVKSNRISWRELECIGVRKDAAIAKPGKRQSDYLAYHRNKMAQQDKRRTIAGPQDGRSEVK